MKRRRLRLVLDTNVWISAFLAEGPASDIIHMAERNRFEIVLSHGILMEINRVLNYRRIVSLLERAGTDPATIIGKVLQLSTIIEPSSTVRAVAEDPEDNKFLACAKDGKADFVVSGDRHLLQVRKYRDITIVSPASLIRTPKLG